MFSLIAFLVSYRREVEAAQRAARVTARPASRAVANDAAATPAFARAA